MGLDGCNPRFAETHRSLKHPGSALTFRRPMSPKPSWSPGRNHCPTFHECPIDPNPAVPCRRGRRRSQESPAHLGRQCVVRCVHYGLGRVQPSVRRNSQVSLQHPGSALELRKPMSPKPRWSPGRNRRPTVHALPIDPNPAVPFRRGRRRSQESPAHLGRQCVVRCVHYALGRVQPTGRRNSHVSAAPWERLSSQERSRAGRTDRLPKRNSITGMLAGPSVQVPGQRPTGDTT